MLDLDLIDEKFKETLSHFSRRDLLDWMEKDGSRMSIQDKATVNYRQLKQGGLSVAQNRLRP